MIQRRAYPIKRDIACLVISLAVFPISLKLALFCFVCFLVIRIDFNPHTHYKLAIKVVLIIFIALATLKLFAESRSLLYPVSYYDYLLAIATVSIIKQNILSIKSIVRVCWAISLSPIIVFVCYFPTFSFSVRNHWGFGNPNWLGLYCSMCLPLILCLLIEEQRKSLAISLGILALALVVTSSMIVSSGSRSSLYTSLIISSIILWRLLSKISLNLFKQPKLLKGYLGLLVFGSTWLCLSFLTEFPWLGRFLDLANSTNIYRIKLYECHLALGMQKPWMGWGINQATKICEQTLRAGAGGVNHAHNFILQLFVDWGLIVTFLSLLTISYFSFLPTVTLIAKLNFSSSVDILHLGISGSSISMVIASLFQSGFYHYPLFPFWLGLLWGCQLNLIEHQHNYTFDLQKRMLLATCNAIKQKT